MAASFMMYSSAFHVLPIANFLIDRFQIGNRQSEIGNPLLLGQK
jgi:hypothetical protein